MILFVGSNPSHLNTCPAIAFAGSKSEETFKKWTDRLVPKGDYKAINVSDEVTPNNRPLKKNEFNLLKLCTDVLDPKVTGIVALGNTASMALEMVGVEFFKLPHPSPLNRQLNNAYFVEEVLKECEKWLHQR